METYLEVVPVDATEDLSTAGHQYKAVDIDGTIAAAVTTALGLLQNKPKSGEDASAGIAGRSRYVAGAAITQGARMTVTTSGFMITAASGDDFVGRALATVSSGERGEGYFNFAAGQA